MTCRTRERGKRRRWRPWCPGWPPLLRPVGFLTTGGGAAGGLAEGGNEELEALSPKRCSESRTRPCRSSICRFSASVRRSRSMHPGQLGWLTPSFYPAARGTVFQRHQNRWAVTLEIRHLSIGEVAPDIEGDDQDGQRF